MVAVEISTSLLSMAEMFFSLANPFNLERSASPARPQYALNMPFVATCLTCLACKYAR